MSYAIERDRPWRSPELNERNGRIVARRREGSTLREVGREFGLSGSISSKSWKGSSVGSAGSIAEPLRSSLQIRTMNLPRDRKRYCHLGRGEGHSAPDQRAVRLDVLADLRQVGTPGERQQSGAGNSGADHWPCPPGASRSLNTIAASPHTAAPICTKLG